VRREADDAVSIAFAVPGDLVDEYRYLPGQHLTLRATLDGEELRRSYSICSGPGEGELRVAIRRQPGGRFSEWAHTHLRPGAVLDVMTPAGRFTRQPDPDSERRYLAIAAGSGITPVIAIVKSILAGEPRSHVTLIYANRTVGSTIFREQLADLKDRYLGRLQVIHVLSRQHQEAPLLNGRLTGERLRALCAGLVRLDGIDEVFLCGPEMMTAELRDTLVELGVERARIRRELFGTLRRAAPPPAPSPNGHERRATLVLNGIATEVPIRPDQTVLEAGLAAGLDLPFSCRGGVCSTCRAGLREGAVEMDANYALEPWELERGFVLTCQSRPVTDQVTIDYDRR
jgi:ring-1,2-phenylacetyl-CoA epoxidase subunit PaaE